MINIRHGVFETNSSSTHSISIAENSDGILDTIVPNEDDSIVLTGGEFGWSWEKFNDPLTKANYCAVDLQSNPATTRLLADVIASHTGAKKVVFAIDKSSYIDHQSVGTSEKAFDNSEVLKNFIFNPKSWLFTGNDNDDAPPNFYDVDDNIVYTHKLCIDGIGETAKFTSYPNDKSIQDNIETLCRRYLLHANSYGIVSWPRTDIDGNQYCSWDHLNEGFVTLFRTKPIYSRDEQDKYLGDKIKSSKQISFKINCI